MNELMGRASWPEKMMDIQKKLLLSSAFDSELDESDPTGDSILKSLVSMYKIKMPLEAGIRWTLYCRGRTVYSAADSSPRITNTDSNSVVNTEGSHAVDVVECVHETASENPTNASDDNPLQKLGITCHNMTLEDFSVYRDREQEKFHLVLGDPSELHLSGNCKKQIDSHDADKVITILKSLVHTHGWVFFYTRLLEYHILHKAFKANDFDPLQYAWPMVRNCDTIQANTSPIPAERNRVNDRCQKETAW